jgi:hypothetical protein
MIPTISSIKIISHLKFNSKEKIYFKKFKLFDIKLITNIEQKLSSSSYPTSSAQV